MNFFILFISKIEVRSMLARMEKNGESIQQRFSPNMLFTANDRDDIDDTMVNIIFNNY